MEPPRSDLVVSGIAGCFPESDDVDEFADNLYGGVDMVRPSRRYAPEKFGIPSGLGMLKDLRRFDASYFSVPSKQADAMDPQLRMLLEISLKAILDSGWTPESLRGKKIGVYVGVSAEDSLSLFPDSFGLKGPLTKHWTWSHRCFLANRLSFAFHFIGPAVTTDTYCSSSLTAFHQAVQDLRLGVTEAALVNGVNLVLSHERTGLIDSIGVLSGGSRSRSFDDSGDGYVRSEAIASVFIQRKENARRSYAEIVHTAINSDGFKLRGPFNPSGERQRELLEEALRRAGRRAEEIAYVEAHATGTKAGDPEEANGIWKVVKGRARRPLLIGSVKSNMGHSEPASGLCSIVKVLIALERGVIPGNLHYRRPNPEIRGISDGTMKVVAENTAWEGGLTCINCFGVGGSNAVVLLDRPTTAEREADAIESGLPKLRIACGRTEEGCRSLLEAHAEDEGFRALVTGIANQSTASQPFRGFHIRGQPGPVVKRQSNERRPVWFVLDGVGSQWMDMGRDILEIPLVRETVLRCAEVLRPHGVDLMGLVENMGEDLLDDMTVTLVIVAVQLALCRLLFSMGIFPDGLFGHSLGEIVSGFVDGCLTLEETILVAHCRVKSLKIAEIEQGAMASIGLSLEEALKICPQGVTIGCHNSIDNVTISGSPAGVESTVKRCESSGIFAKGVPSFGYAFHSPSMDKAAPHLRESLSQVIGQPKKRSAKWVSTSVSRDDPVGEHCSAEYQIRNFCSMVRFQEAMMRVPENAIVIEIGPHSILFPLLKRSLSSKATLVGIQNRREKDNCLYLLKMLGQLYNEGLDMDLNAIYRFRYPVPRGTPMLSPQIVLDHSQQWFVPSPAANAGLSSSVVEVDLSKEEFDHLKWVRYGGEPVIPPEAFLVMVWEALAKRLESDKFELDVSFTDVRFHGVKFCGDAVAFDLNVEILSSSGRWEVSEGGRCLAEGTVHITEGTVHIAKGTVHIEATKRARAPWDPDEIYQELSLRGCECAGAFRCMEAFWGQGGVVSWQPSLVPFLHNVFQTLNLTKVRGQEGVLTGFGCLRVSPKAFLKEQAVEIHAKGNRIWGNCLEWTEIQTQEIPRKQFDPIPLSAQIFTPFLDDDETYEENEGLEICLKIVLQQFPHEETLRIVHFTGKGEGSERIRASLQTGTAKKTISLAVVTGHADGLKSPDHSHLQIWEDMAHFAQSSSYKSDFALVRFADGENPRFKQDSLRLVAKKVERTKSGKVFTWALLKEGSEGENAETVVPVDAVSDFSWVESLQDLLKDEKRTGVCLQSENHPIGLFGLVNSLGREFPAGGVRAEAGPRDSGRFLVQNFHQDGKWGTYIYRDLTLARPVEEKAEWSVTERERGGLEWVCRPRPVGEVCKVFAAGFDGSFAGTDSGGRRVMGLVVREEHGVVASFASPESDFVWEIPSCWSYEEAAAIPFSYAVGFAAFQLACGGRSDAHVLLTSSEHPLVGCFVAIAESVRCKLAVLVETVDSECSGFVGYSDPDAVPWKSVDAVFVMDDDWDWVKARKSELTVVDLRPIVCEDRRSSADLAGFASYHRLSLDFIARCSELRARVSEAVKTGIKSGVVKPLPFHDVNPEAFSADVRFRGDAVMSIRSVDGRTRIKARKQLRFESEEVVIITGGLGGMGLELVQFLIDHGAQKFLLTSRRGVTSGRQGHKIGTWRSRGIQVRVSTLEISTEEQAKALIQEGSSMGHLVGIFHLAGTLRDGRFVKAGRGDFESVAGPKVGALQCVDRVSREWCPGLKYFVAFSSVVVGVGNVGQTAYGMANGAMEDVIRDRRRSDCPGLAIEWGPIAEVGMASKILARTNKVSIASCRAQSIHASWDRLETLLLAQDDLPSPIVTVAILEAFEPEPEPEHVEPKEENLLERVAKVLDMPLETLDPNRSLAEMGLDSMASVHIEQMFKPMHLSLEEIAQLTLRKVQALISSSA